MLFLKILFEHRLCVGVQQEMGRLTSSIERGIAGSYSDCGLMFLPSRSSFTVFTEAYLDILVKVSIQDVNINSLYCHVVVLSQLLLPSLCPVSYSHGRVRASHQPRRPYSPGRRDWNRPPQEHREKLSPPALLSKGTET